jgi:hypothetical protein
METPAPADGSGETEPGGLDWATIRFGFSLFGAVATCVFYAALFVIDAVL